MALCNTQGFSRTPQAHYPRRLASHATLPQLLLPRSQSVRLEQTNQLFCGAEVRPDVYGGACAIIKSVLP